MSVDGSTVVSVTRPNVIAQAMGGHGYGAAPLARGEMAPREPTREAAAPRKLALVKPTAAEPAEPKPAGLEPAAQAELTQAELEFMALEFAVIDLETTGWAPGVAAITEVAAVR